MLLKRSLALAVGLLLFIGGFFVYFGITDAKLEERFHQERLKFGVEGNLPMAATLTASAPASPPANSSPTPLDKPAPAPAADTNIIIGPMPPPVSSTPDNTPPPPASFAPDSNSAPATPSSTMMRSRLNPRSFLVFAAYTPSGSMRSEAPASEPAPFSTGFPPPLPLLSPSTNAPSTNGEFSLPPATNETSSTPPSTNSDAPRPVPIEASVIVLGYHQFMAAGQSSRNEYMMSQDVFEQEMKYLNDNGYHVIPLSDVVRFTKHEIGLQPKSVAITIDDGYKSAIVYAAPILKKYGYPWTYFVYPEFITVTEGKGAASWPDLLALQADGVDIESHSMTHPQLPKKAQKFKGHFTTLSPEEYDEFLTTETAGSKALLEQKLGKPVPFFAYPYGAYNKQVEAKAIAAGYEAIFTVADNPVHSTTDVHSIGRYIITHPVEKLFANYLRQGALSVAEANPAPGTTTSQPRPVITAILGYAGNLDPKSIETSVRDFGDVRHDFDPKTSTVRLYLPRDLIQEVNIVNIRVRDADSGQMMVANWHFNYEPANGAATPSHPPIAETPPSTNNVSSATNAAPSPQETPTTQAEPTKKVTSSTHSAPTNNTATPATSSAPESEHAPSTSSKNPAKSHVD